MADGLFINRELSWLEFQARILEIAGDRSKPVFERLRFLVIFSESLDEFFQVRVAGLKDQLAAGLKATSPDGRSASEQLEAIRSRVLSLKEIHESLFLDDIGPQLRDHGIELVRTEQLGEEERKYVSETFENKIFPVLTPLAVDPAHPFPYISNLSLNIGALVEDPDSRRTRRFARIKVPPVFPRFLRLPEATRFVALEEVIREHLPTLFPGMHVVASCVFRVTRNADLSFDEDEADDLLEAVEMELRRRRFNKAVRLEIEASAPSEAVELLTRELDLDDSDVYYCNAPIDLAGLTAIAKLDRPGLSYRPATQVIPRGFGSDSDLFAMIRAGDVLVHHPYESFTGTIQMFLEQAARDPRVLAIKQTLYRTAWNSPVVKALAEAAERGKQVAAVVELKARFDEEANIGWARLLERAGVHVTYGLVGLKTHCKCLLVVRSEQDRIVRYCHVATGNYNHETAKSYEDLGLLTADSLIGEDLTELFNFLTGCARPGSFKRLIVSPGAMREALAAHIQREAAKGRDGRVFIKVNNLTDRQIIEALYDASRAGASVQLVVRSICCLVPGVPGASDNVSVKSIVGRYLEHSRIFRFGHPGEPDCTYLIGSADLMERNLDRRVEVLVPILSPPLKERLEEIIRLNLEDDANSWHLNPDGSWTRVASTGMVDLHQELLDRAIERNRIVASV